MALWLFPLAFAYLYGLIGGVEFLLPLFGLIDRSARTQSIIRHWFSPVWEVTNVFFVAAVTSFAALFPFALPVLPDHLRFWLLVSGAMLALRAALTLSFFYATGGENRSLQKLLAVVSLTLPVVLAQVVLAIVLPNADLIQSLGAGAIGLSLAVALCSGLFFGLNPSDTRYKLTAQIAWAAVVLSFLLMGGADSSLVTVGVVVGCTGIGAILLSALSSYRWATLLLSGAIYTVLAVELAIRQWPYVIFGQLSYDAVKTGPAIGGVIGWGMVAGLFLIVPPLIWLGTLVVRQQRS